MDTRIYKKREIEDVAQRLKEGELVAIMTDTVYGLAASTHDSHLYQKLIDVKHRPDTKPFPLMVRSYDQIEDVADVEPWQRNLMHKFMPGAVTFIFKRKEGVFDFLGDQKTLGIRMADDVWVQELIDHVGYPLWLPSANVSGMPTATSSTMVLEQLNGKIAGVIEGNISGGISSSVFDLTGSQVVCLREGIIPLSAILEEVKNENNSVSM